MNYMPEAIEDEKARLLNLTVGDAQKAQDGLNLLEPYIRSLDEINRLLDLSGELYILAMRYNKDAANEIVARFARDI